MPYKIVKDKDRYCVVNSETGENKGCSKTRKMAIKHMRALYHVEGGGKMTKEQLDDLVTKGLDELGEQVDADELKEALESKGGWFPYTVTAWDDLDAYREAAEHTQHIIDVTYDFQTLVSNVMYATEIEDKAAAVQALAEGFAVRLKASDDAYDDGEDKERKTYKEQESFIERIVAKLKGLVSKDQGDVKVDSGASRPDACLMVWKEEDGIYRWLTRYSNNFRDQDSPPEIISEKSHRRFVDRVEKGLEQYPELWLWHVPEWTLGRADWLAWDTSGFALAAGQFYKGREGVAEWLSSDQTKGWGVSHGMPKDSIAYDQSEPSVIIEHSTREISPLPFESAANKRTGFIVFTKEAENMAIPTAKKQALIERWNLDPKMLEELEALNAEQAKEALASGVEYKETPVVPTTGSETPAAPSATAETDTSAAAVTEPQPPITREEIASAVAKIVVDENQKVAESIKALQEQMDALSKELQALSQSDEAKIANKAAEIPVASLTALIARRVIGSPEAQLATGDKLAAAKPKETPAVDPGTGIPFLDKMLAGSDKK